MIDYTMFPSGTDSTGPITREKFLELCAVRSNSTVEHVLEYHEISECKCGDPGCRGWKATYLLENRRRARKAVGA